MPLSHRSRWQRVARTLSWSAMTVALTATAGCRGDGSTRPSLSAMSPMRWFARGETADDGEETELNTAPGGDYSVPPVPPSSPVGRAFVPAAPPAADSFYDVRPTSQETHESEPRPWSQTLRGMFEPEPKLKPIPPEVEPISHESAGIGAYHRSSGAANLPPVPPPLLVPPAEPEAYAYGPANISTHIEPVASPRQPGRLPIITARSFPMRPSAEPTPWPYRSVARDEVNREPRRFATVQSPQPRATFLPLPGDDDDNGPALLP